MTGEPRKPMTPGRAKRFGCYWLAAGFVFLIVATALNMTGFDMVMPLPFVVSAICFGKMLEYTGWRDGYSARAAEENAEVERSLRGESR